MKHATPWPIHPIPYDLKGYSHSFRPLLAGIPIFTRYLFTVRRAVWIPLAFQRLADGLVTEGMPFVLPLDGLSDQLLESLFLPGSIGQRIRQQFILLIPNPFPPIYFLVRFLLSRPFHFTGEFHERIGFHGLLDILVQFQCTQLQQLHLLHQMEIQLLSQLGFKGQFGSWHGNGPPFFKALPHALFLPPGTGLFSWSVPADCFYILLYNRMMNPGG